MAGRRLRDAVKNVLISGSNGEFGTNIHVVLAGLTNTYSQYVTTFEEYQIQRYEVYPTKQMLHNFFSSHSYSFLAYFYRVTGFYGIN